MKKQFLGIMVIGFLLFGCSKEAPVVGITGNQSIASPGETVTITVNATHDKKIRLVNVEGTLYYENDGSMIQTKELGFLFESSEKAPSISGTFNYVIPYMVGIDSITGGDYDYIEFIAYCESGNGNASSNFNVTINP